MGDASPPPVGDDPGSVFEQAIASLESSDEPGPLRAWLSGELDKGGVPRRLSVGAWWPALLRLAEARARAGRRWPPSLDARLAGFVLAAVRFTRPDGSAVFRPTDAPRAGEADLGPLAGWIEALGLRPVFDDWAGRRTVSRRATRLAPEPDLRMADRPLAMLRSGWAREVDWLALDGRDTLVDPRFEFAVAGRPLLGPDLTVEPVAGRAPLKPSAWPTGPDHLGYEWDAGGLTWTALLLPGRRLTLLGVEVEGGASRTLRVRLADGVAAGPVSRSRALKLKAGGQQALVLPLGLPEADFTSPLGAFLSEGPGLVLRQGIDGRRGWMPLLVAWDASRQRRPARWRPLTVSKEGSICPAAEAFAVRVAWGDEQYLIYRSLGPPARRVVLGHQVDARFLFASFTLKGDVMPIVRVGGPG